MTTPSAEDKLCTSCAQRNSPGNIAETPCAAPGKARRTTPTPSTTGGPPGGDSGGGQDAGDREAPDEVRSTSPATPRTIGGPGSRFFGTGSRGDSSSEVTPRCRSAGDREPASEPVGRARRTPMRSAGHGTASSDAGPRRSERETASASAARRTHGCTDSGPRGRGNLTAGRVDVPRAPRSHTSRGPHHVPWCLVPHSIPGATRRGLAHSLRCAPSRDMCRHDAQPTRRHTSRPPPTETSADTTLNRRVDTHLGHPPPRHVPTRRSTDAWTHISGLGVDTAGSAAPAALRPQRRARSPQGRARGERRPLRTSGRAPRASRLAG
jgi:hypothetical protein